MNTQTRSELISRMQTIHDKAVAENRDLTDQENTDYTEAKALMDKTVEQPDPKTLKLADGPAVITKQRSYSVLRAIGWSLGDSNAGDIGLERELHQQLSKGKPAKGVMVPLNAILGKAGQSTLTAGAGGVLARTDVLLADLLADVDSAIRYATILGPLGVSTITVPADQKVRIPIKTGPGVASFVTRDGDAAVTDLTFSDVESMPHTLATGARLNRSSLIYSVPSMEAIVRSDLGIAVADAVNNAYLNGSAGSSLIQPNGLIQTLSGASRDFTTEINATPTLKKFLQWSDLHVETYAEVGHSRAWLMHPRTADTLRSTIWGTGGTTPIMTGSTLEDDPVVETHRAVIGSTPYCAYGDWADSFVIFYGPAMDMLANPYHPDVYLSGGIIIRGLMDLDIVFRDVKRLAMASDVVS
jgi:HK97 family phage major capsid protein